MYVICSFFQVHHDGSHVVAAEAAARRCVLGAARVEKLAQPYRKLIERLVAIIAVAVHKINDFLICFDVPDAITG